MASTTRPPIDLVPVYVASYLRRSSVASTPRARGLAAAAAPPRNRALSGAREARAGVAGGAAHAAPNDGAAERGMCHPKVCEN